MNTPVISPAAIDIRSYGALRTADRHAYAQLVLPVGGQVDLEIAGRAARLDPLRGAVVAAGAWHSQCSDVANRSLVVDLDQRVIEEGGRARLLERPFGTIGPAARKLVEYMALVAGEGGVAPALVAGWLPLLLDTLAAQPAQCRSRLAALLAQVGGDPGLPWTTGAMARCAGLSVSRLHALFRAELDTSPHAWLLQRRLELACGMLAAGTRPIADIAVASGFSDQSALTRAMRDLLDVTPAAFRRQRQESASTPQ